MARTLHRPPAGETPHELDFLEGIDLEGEHRRPRALTTRSVILVGGGLLILLAAIVATIVLTGDGTTTREYVDSGHRPVSYDVEATSLARDSWTQDAVARHEAELAAVHDARIDQLVTARVASLDAMYDSGHRPMSTTVAPEPVVVDGWMGPALDAYQARLDAMYDSGHRPLTGEPTS
jgi:hypothetical protein